MTYARMGQRSLDFSLCQYGQSRNLFRGPKKSIQNPFIACLGSSDTFGQTVPAPYAMLLERQMPLPIANFGIINAGIDAYLNDPDLLGILGQAEYIILQVMGAQGQSNDYYTVHPRRNDRFVKAHDKLKELFPEIDFTEFHFTRHMLSHLETADTERFDILRKHLRRTWRRKMKLLCDKLPIAPHLLWFSSRPLAQKERGLLEADPNFITADDIKAISRHTKSLINVTREKPTHRLPSFAVLEELDQSAHQYCADVLSEFFKQKGPLS